MTIINTLPFQLQNGTTADATQVMADFDEIVNDVNNNAAHNGVNSDITALTALTTPITPAGGGSTIFIGGTAGGTATALTLASTVPIGFALTVGWRVVFTPATGNTGAATMAVGATAATAILRATPAGVLPLIGGELVAGVETELIYDGTEYVLLTNTAQVGGFGANTLLASATVTDLGTIPSHQVAISGTTTITAFGASASVAYPIYQLQFNSSLVITYDAVAMILPGSTSITTQPGDFAIAKYIGVGAGNGNWRILAYYRQNGQALNLPSNLLQNYLAGLILSTAGGSGTFGVTAGEAADSTNAQLILLNSAFTKTTGAWAAGTGNGALDTGSISPSTWYHMFVIFGATNDVLFSLSPSSPTLPSGYTFFRRIGSMKTDGSSHWTAFTQVSGKFIWSAEAQDASSAAFTTTRSLVTLTVPTGVVVNALMRVVMNINSGGFAIFTSLFESDQAPASVIPDFSPQSTGIVSANLTRLTNTSAQIGVRANTASGATYSIGTYGWEDNRGT